MHVEKNVCESLVGTLFNMNGKTRDHGRAHADLKKIGIRQELCLDDFVKEEDWEKLSQSVNLQSL
jgi:hypothetical protein